MAFDQLIERDISGGFAPSTKNMPKFISDVTIPVCYALTTPKNKSEDRKLGLTLSGSKQSILGFFNPIPPCLPVEHESPTLCIVYKKKIVDGADESITEIGVDYYRETQKVEILLDN